MVMLLHVGHGHAGVWMSSVEKALILAMVPGRIDRGKNVVRKSHKPEQIICIMKLPET